MPDRVNAAPGPRAERAWLVAWYAVATLFVIAAPLWLWFGGAFWRLPAERLPAGLVMGLCHLALALFLRVTNSRSLAAPLAAGLVFFGAGYLILIARPDLITSTKATATAGALAILLACVPVAFSRHIKAASLALGAVLAAQLALSARSPDPAVAQAAPATRDIATTLNTLSATYLRGLGTSAVPRDGPVVQATGGFLFIGGAIARDGSGFLLVNGSGHIFRLTGSANTLSSTKLELAVPMDPEGVIADQTVPWRTLRYRVTGIALDQAEPATRIYVAHQHWDRSQKCFTVRVSTAALPGSSDGPSGAPAPSWRTLFESRPCLPVKGSFEGSDNGGRLAWDAQGRLLLTLGDHGLSGQAGSDGHAQSQDSHYGKVVTLDLAGNGSTLTLGHRNPQGLLVDRKGRVWATEHGPQGGDELNRLLPGRHYGWPYVTYGTEYGLKRWPVIAPTDRAFEPPVHAFMPSIAISNLIEVGPAMFPEWEGDLLVASLRAQALFRIRLDGDRVAYVERIPIGRRIRDLAQGHDGRIVLWTDEGDVVVLTRSAGDPQDNVMFGRCSRCHEAPANTPAFAPALRGVVARPVASVRGFAYSDALRRLGGTWTQERLDAFLTNPATFAPGTSMAFEGIANSAERKALIEFLQGYR